MKKYSLLPLLVIFFLSCFGSYAQNLQSPQEFLGYELGTKFSRHHQIISYFEYVARQNPGQVKLIPYGKTNEGRPLMVAVIASEDNLARLEEIRTNNLKSAGLLDGQASAKQPALVWFSYNVHGNEPTSSEASMQVLYEISNKNSAFAKQILSNTVVFIDPCINPDGRDRYANWYNQKGAVTPDVNPVAWEHYEPWPQGRYNHYCFDLNRDWAWQVQVESQQRIPFYNQWMPQIHVDFHEQSYTSPYYFAPAAKPFHEDITPWQREFQTTVGTFNAKRFDANNWLYFTKERFDLFYPSYGDTYPTYNGAIGMTFEQGGIRGGLGVTLPDGDTLTLKKRISHHVATSFGTLEAANQNAEKLVSEFVKFYEKGKTNPAGPYKSFVIKTKGDESKVRQFSQFLDKNGFQYGIAGKDMLASGFSFSSDKTEGFKIEAEDLVLNLYQPRSTYLRILLDPKPMLEDSLTYDITSWSLLYAYGLKAYGLKDKLTPVAPKASTETYVNSAIAKPYAYLAAWKSFDDMRFLAGLLKQGVKVRASETAFESNGQSYQPGTLVITRASNERLGDKFDQIVKAASEEFKVKVNGVASGWASKGSDFGSSNVFFLKAPKVAIVGGEGTASTGFGEVWHFFERQINYPATVLGSEYFNNIDLRQFDVLILPSGSYSKNLGDRGIENIRNFAKAGGKVIAIESAVDFLSGKPDFDIAHKEEAKKKENQENLGKYEDREREEISEDTQGCVYRITLDNTHPLAFGYDKSYLGLILSTSDYQFLKSGWNVGISKEKDLVAGFAGKKAQEKLKNSLFFGVQDLGKGEVVYLVNNPIFRGFWQNGKLLFGNAVFMVGN